MTTIRITVEDDEVNVVKKLLLDSGAVKSIEEERKEEMQTPYERIKALLDDAKGKNLFADIEDPSEWQRQIRKEWDRDF